MRDRRRSHRLAATLAVSGLEVWTRSDPDSAQTYQRGTARLTADTAAEMTAPAYKGVGVELYSSAVFAFAPEIALPFHRALAEDDDALVSRLLDHGLEVAAA